MKRTLRLVWWFGAITAIPTMLQAQSQAPASNSGIALEALITDERLGELSGMAASRQHPGIFWVHNDGDNPAELHAIDARGRHRATLRIAGLRNVDWEDLAAFEWKGKHYLLIADVGDNGGLRRELPLRVIEEPAVVADARVAVAWTLRFRWPDGARDCESVAVDAVEGAVFLVSKKRVPPELFRIGLIPTGHRVQTAQRVGLLAGVEQPTLDDLSRNPVYGRYRSQITSADISADGSLFAVLNYRRVYVWSRDPAGWSAAVRQPPRVAEFPWIPQAEAITFDRDGRSLWITSERLPAPLMRLPVPAK